MIGSRAADHFVWGLPHVWSLDQGIAWLEQLTGVRAAVGGRHVGLGTHNAVTALGSGTYLEILAVDPSQPDGAKWMGMQKCPGAPRFVSWAARPGAPFQGEDDSLGSMVEGARAKGYDPGDPQSFARKTTTDETLNWRLAFNHYGPPPLPGGGLVPFLIDWGAGAAPPMNTAPKGLQLIGIEAMHPDPQSLVAPLAALGLDSLQVVEGTESQLVLVLETPKGRVRLGCEAASSP